MLSLQRIRGLPNATRPSHVWLMVAQSSKSKLVDVAWFATRAGMIMSLLLFVLGKEVLTKG